MKNYATYEQYIKKYMPVKKVFDNAKSFDFYAREATQQIKLHTLYNIDETNIPKVVMMCCCELAEQMYGLSGSTNNVKSGITSERVGDWSVSYSNIGDIETQKNSITTAIIRKWFTGTGLLYRGVR